MAGHESQGAVTMIPYLGPLFKIPPIYHPQTLVLERGGSKAASPPVTLKHRENKLRNWHRD